MKYTKNCVEYFKAFDSEKELRVTSWVKDSLYFSSRHPIYRKWYMTKLFFAEGDEKQLTIKYKIENTKRDVSPGFSFITRFSDRHFTYHLFPSSKWGDGIVNDFSVNIDVSYLDSTYSKYSIEGIEGLTKSGNIYSLSAKDYDLNQSERLNINYSQLHLKMAKIITNWKLPDFVISSVIPSSNKETAHYLTDGDPNTYWTGKKNDYIDVYIRQIYNPNSHQSLNYFIGGVLALNGAFSSKNEFDNNGTIRTYMIILNDTILYNTEIWSDKMEDKILYLERPKFQQAKNNAIKGLASILADDYLLKGNSYKAKIPNFTVTKIRIKILSIHEGIENNGTFAISELYFVSGY